MTPFSKSTRVRGFAPWRPQKDALALIEHVRVVLREYDEYLPLTCRQIYYRLIGTGVIEKGGRGYKRLCEILNRGRRAEYISFEDIRDDGLTEIGENYFSGPDHVIEALRRTIDNFKLDPMAGQPRTILLLCEAAGMVPQLASVANPYGVRVISSGGFDSTTVKHDFSLRLAGQNTLIFHAGDYDPSGVHLFSSLAQDVCAFLGGKGNAEFKRLGVNPAQIKVLGLSTQPKNPNDDREFDGVDGDGVSTCQLEAIPPDKLASIVRATIFRELDLDALAQIEPQQRAHRDNLRKMFPKLWEGAA